MLFCLNHPPLAPDGKALALPIINPFDRHGRVFFFAWSSFMISFFAWYSIPPLLNHSIRQDLNLTDNEIANSNIIALVAGLLVRLVTGPLCDRFGPRRVLVALLWISAIPCGLAATVNNAASLYVVRGFIGISGGCFVPSQVWIAGWFDRSVIGTSTAFTGGWGDAGAGVTSLVMPAVFHSLVDVRGLAERVGWRVTFVVPPALLITFGILTLTLADDTPTGSWATRNAMPTRSASSSTTNVGVYTVQCKDKNGKDQNSTRRPSDTTMLEQGRSPSPAPSTITLTNATKLRRLFSLQTLLCAAPYGCTFGCSLVMNSILVAYYSDHFPQWSETKATSFAAMFGLLNFVTRPAGGMLADVLYRRCDSDRKGIVTKKYWMCALMVVQATFCLWIGLLNPASPAVLVGGIAGLAVFMEAANGAVYALVPHITFNQPEIAGLTSGSVGAAGNAGGVIFSVVARFTQHAETIWIVGVVTLVVAVGTSIITPPERREETDEI